MENLLNYFPPIIENHKTNQRLYLTIGADDDCWHVTYMTSEGYPAEGFIGSGLTIFDALTKLKEVIDTRTEIINMLQRPAVRVDELTGKMLPPEDGNAKL